MNASDLVPHLSAALPSKEANLFRFISRRFERGSIIFTSNAGTGRAHLATVSLCRLSSRYTLLGP